jgi:general secretion pathway protein G
MYTSKSTRPRAFTLLEIMLVVMIIAILAGAAIHLMGTGPIETTKGTVAQNTCQAFKTSLIQYQTVCGRLPTNQQGLAALSEKPTTEPKPPRWNQFMEKIPLDPWSNAYVYRVPGVRHPKSYDVFSAGADGKPDTDDDIYPD